ncbi:MAG: universal stress protein, partial [Chloroflexota bacterium]|nr:universal stress protein [Chloroflexota bacterium]
NLLLTYPGQYETLKEHIRVHRHYMGNEQQREIPIQEATRHWYDLVYSPIIDIIREQEILQEFPERTETDLYIWLLDHQSYMEKELGWSVRPEKAATDFVNRRGKSILRILDKIGRSLIAALLPKPLEDFSSPGEWRLQKEIVDQNLFSDILVAMSGRSESWIALEQAIIISQLENAEVRGLVVNDQSDMKIINENDLTQAYRERLDQVAISGNLVFSKGHVAETICERAKVNDLVILKLSYPPLTSIFSRLSSGMRMILRQSTCPILIVKDQVSTMNHILLAYDASPKGKEALFVASYLASKYGRKISVLAVEDDENKGKRLLKDAEEVVGECFNKIQFYQYPGRTSDVILQVANELSVDMILMGGYGLQTVLEILFGSTVDVVLRGSRIPVFVCK